MARIPGPETLGARPTPTSRRGIASYQGGHEARALAQGGSVIATAGADIRDQELRQQREDDALELRRQQKQATFDGARARSYLAREAIQAQSVTDDEDYATFEQRYGERMQKARETASKLISDPDQRALFDLDAEVDFERGLSAVRDKAKVKERDYGLTTLQQSLDENDAAALATPDDVQSGRLISLNNQMIDGAVARGYVAPDDAYKLKRDRALTFAKGRTDAMIANRPEDIVSLLAPKGSAAKPTSVADIDRDLAIRTIWGEARGESPEGQAAVANVIMNRVASGRWGDNVGKVVKASGQFEPWGNPDTRREMEALKPGEPAYEAIGEVWDRVQSGQIPDITAGATHFVSGTTQVAMGRKMPVWAKGKLAEVGKHTFYAPEGAVSGRPQIPSKTGTVLDVLPADQRLKAFQEAAKTAVEGAMMTDPLKASSLLEKPEYMAALGPEQVAKYRSTAQTRFTQMQDTAKTQRVMQQAQANQGIFQQAIDGQLTMPALAKAESEGLDREFAGYLRESLMVNPPQKTEGEQAAAYVDVSTRLDQAIAKRGTAGAKYKGDVEEFLKLQRDVLKMKNGGLLTGRDAATFMGQINRGVMKKLPGAGNDAWYDFDGNDTPYETGFKAIRAFTDTQGDGKDMVAKAEIMRRFTYALGELPEDQQAAKAPAIARQAIESYAKSKFPILSMMDGTPSAVLRPGGERVTTSPQPTAKADATVKTGKVMRDAKGNYVRVFADGTFEPLTGEQARALQAKGG